MASELKRDEPQPEPQEVDVSREVNEPPADVDDEGGWTTAGHREADDLWDERWDGDKDEEPAPNEGGQGVGNDELPLDDVRRTPDPSAAAWDIRGANEHDLKLVAIAVEERIDTLRGLQKKNEGEGYLREARNVAADADRLAEAVLPALKIEQPEFPTLTAVEARSGIANHLHDVIRRYVRNSEGPEDNPIEAFENEVCQRVERFGRRIAERAFAAGMAARGAHPTEFMLGALEQLDHQELRESVAAGET